MAFGTLAAAQTANILPAEFPPASFDANQYVDSDGCAFIRAGISGAVTWVPRMSRGREQLCGFEPTFAVAPEPEPAPAPAAETAPVVVAEPAPAPVAAPAPAPVVAEAPAPAAPAPVVAQAPAAPAPAPRLPRVAVGAPTTTVASIVTPPTIGRQAPPVAPAPVVAPVGVPEATSAVEAPTPVRQSVACDGLFGVQPNLINARTGEPIDCGPAPQVAAVSAPEATAPQAIRMTVAQVCEEMARTGRSYINQATGAPVDCPSAPPAAAQVAAPMVLAAAPAPVAPVAPVRPVAPAAPVATPAAVCPGVTYVGGTDRYPVRCGPQALSPSGLTNAARPLTAARAATPTLGTVAVPASNPVGAVPVPTTPLPGYQSAWDDGRVNLNRGVPQQASGAVVAQPATARVSTRAVPQAVAPAPAPAPQGNGHRYVQVGTYGDPANAQRAVARLQGLGLPAGTAQTSRNGQALQIVVAGPFADAASLQRALGAARSSGYSDAFTRR